MAPGTADPLVPRRLFDAQSGWRWTFVAAVLLLAFAGGAAFFSVRQLAEASDRVEQTYEVVQALDSAMSQVKDAETGHRGYLLTGDRLFLVPYERAAPVLLDTTTRLRTLVANSPSQAERVDRFRRLAEAKLEDLAAIAAEYNAGRADEAVRRVASGHGRRLMDELRLVAADIERAERSLLATRATQMQAAQRTSDLFVGATALAALSIALVGSVVNRQLARRARAIAREIEDRRMAEAALRRSEARFSVALRAAPITVSTTDAEGRYTWIHNPPPGLDADRIVGKRDDEFLPPREARDIMALKERVLRTGVGERATVSLPREDEEFTYDMTVEPLRSDDGGVAGLTMAAFDLTPVVRAERERLLAQERIRESEQKFRTLADTMPQIVWSTRPDGYHDYFNARWYEYTGLPRPDEPGDPAGGGQGWSWKERVHPEDRERTEAAWSRSLAHGEPFHAEYRLRRNDESYRWFIGRALPLRDETGAITRWFGTSTDIDDQKKVETEREHLLHSERVARSEAERAARTKDEFVATLSHELRTPLNAIMGWTSVLKRDRAPAAVEKGLDVIDRNARVQAQMIEDLLDTNRILSGKIRLEVQRVDLAEVIDAALSSVEPTALARGVRLIKVLGSAGPVSGDPARLQQVVWNLLTNAIKFTPRGGKVHVTLKKSGSHVQIVVSDTGQGVRPEFLPHVFERFRQADSSTTRRHGGLGLGLSIVKNLVEIHGGIVEAASGGEGQGAVFSVHLPLAAAFVEPESPSVRALSAATEREDDPTLDGIHVLIVDDEPDARDLVERLLRECGADVVTASSGVQALAFVRDGLRPDVIVSDIGMPELDGYEFIRRARSLEGIGNTPAAALTALARMEDRKRALLAGYHTHVAKPVDPSELLAVVASLAGRTGRPPTAH